MALKIEIPRGELSLTEFLRFHDRVCRDRAARWPAELALELPLLMETGPFAEGRELRPFLIRDSGDIVARACAVLDSRYNRHWNERLGHIVMFEALPDSRDAVRTMIDSACEWLESRGAQAARMGWGLFDFPFVVDDYETLPPNILRPNPEYYHCLIKDAGFETEQGWVDYRIKVTPELTARYQSALEAALRGGFEILPLKQTPPATRVADFTRIWNDAFKRHWGTTPFSEAEVALLFELWAHGGGGETSVIAYRRKEPVGTLMVLPESSAGAVLSNGRVLREEEKVNFLGIGVHESARGRGVNLAMASYSFLKLIEAGAKCLSYTLVLDDNWPSRRTAEKLGASVCANYVTYRRNFR